MVLTGAVGRGAADVVEISGAEDAMSVIEQGFSFQQLGPSMKRRGGMEVLLTAVLKFTVYRSKLPPFFRRIVGGVNHLANIT